MMMIEVASRTPGPAESYRKVVAGGWLKADGRRPAEGESLPRWRGHTAQPSERGPPAVAKAALAGRGRRASGLKKSAADEPSALPCTRPAQPAACAAAGLGATAVWIIAFMYSRFRRPMKSCVMAFGQTALHSYWLVQFPKPSASICRTIARTR